MIFPMALVNVIRRYYVYYAYIFIQIHVDSHFMSQVMGKKPNVPTTIDLYRASAAPMWLISV